MIISGLLSVVFEILSGLLSFLPSLPALPAVITDVWAQLMTVTEDGLALVGNWVYLPVALLCLLITVSIELFLESYKLIAWFVNKIPFINIKM